MIDQLINLVKEHAGDSIIKNPAIPDEHNETAIKTAAGGIMDQLKNLSADGKMDSITDIFKGGNVSTNPVTTKISSNVASQLVSKFGISQDQATSIVKSLIPIVMSSLVKKTNDPGDKSFNLQGILGSLAGGKAGDASDIMGSMKNIFGKK